MDNTMPRDTKSYINKECESERTKLGYTDMYGSKIQFQEQ